TPRDQKAVKTAAQTMRANPEFDAEQAIMELGTGEALVSFLDEKGRPSVVERAFVLPPASRLGPLTEAERAAIIQHSPMRGRYEQTLDRESAYEKLTASVAAGTSATPSPTAPTPTAGGPAAGDGGLLGGLNDLVVGATGPRGGQRDGIAQMAAKTVARTIASSVGREIMRGVLGSILGGRRK
ncbi:MAG: DUF853 family protein, partial [Methyloversatilis sp.]|nr:DUF853 family protein [Methyloversatilis sp.]